MVSFINVIKKDSKVRVQINNKSDRSNRLPLEYESQIGCDSLMQNVILKELINIMGTTITDLYIELKMKNSRIELLESKTNSKIFNRVWSAIVFEIFVLSTKLTYSSYKIVLMFMLYVVIINEILLRYMSKRK